MYRQGQLLNLRHEKITEDMLLSAVQAAVKTVHPQSRLIDYTSSEIFPTRQDGRYFFNTNSQVYT